jgi:hypothetical protein
VTQNGRQSVAETGSEVSMSVDIIEKEEDAAVEAHQIPASESAPAPEVEKDIDQLLSEWDQRQKPSELPLPGTPIGADSNQPEQTEQQPDPLDSLLQELNGPDPRIKELEGQVEAARVTEYRRQEMAAFESFTADLQKQVVEIAPHVPEDYVRAKLEALAHDPTVALAWDLRNVDRREASIELQKAQVLLAPPPAGATPQQIAELQNYGARLQIAVNSHAILRKAIHGILNDARKIPPPVDHDVMAARAEIAQVMKHASGPIDAKEPPIEWGKLSANEGRRAVKEKYGFDPGWGH